MNMAEIYINKISSLLELIKKVDGVRIKSPMSDYGTVSDILEKMKLGNELSSSQLKLITDIKKLYVTRYDKL